MSFLEQVVSAAMQKAADPDAERLLSLRRETPVLDLGPRMGRLRKAQFAALQQIKACDGGFVATGCGSGKSWVAVLAATVLDRESSLIVAPAATLHHLQEVHTMLADLFDVRPAHLLSYSAVSTNRYALESALCKMGGDEKNTAIIFDEAHFLKSFSAARTKRVLRFLQAHREMPVVVLSGTMTTKSVMDFAHLAAASLRERTFLPTEWQTLKSWASVVDDTPEPPHPTLLSQMGRVIGPADHRAGARRRFAEWIRNAPGVTLANDDDVGASLYVSALSKNSAVSDVLRKAIRTARADGCNPEGRVWESGADASRDLCHLALGFYYRWEWPDDVVDVPWLTARNRWSGYVRHYLDAKREQSDPDSPALVVGSMQRDAYSFPRPMRRAWEMWTAEMGKDAPPSVPVWLDTTQPAALVKAAIAVAGTDRLTVWYQSRAVADQLERSGYRVFRAGETPPNDGELACLSVRAHGTGLNLQAWSVAFVLEPPAGAAAWEQMIARHHRSGQEADSVTFYVNSTTYQLRKRLTSAVDGARYVCQTTGLPQRLTCAIWTPC